MEQTSQKVKSFLVHNLPLLALLGTAAFFFYKLGRNPFSDWDECLYAQYTSEMPKAHYFLSNIWNGYIDMQKPPLYTWILRLFALFFGETEFSLRSVSALSGIGLIASVYLFAKKHFSTLVAVFASLILLCSELFVIYSLKLNTDIIYTLFLFLAFWAWISSYSKPKWAYVAGLLFGVSTMLKGIGSIQFAGALFLTLFINFRREDFYRYVRMMIVCGLVILPWHLLMYFTYGEKFIRIYFLENILKRGKYPLEFHRERWWFYFVLIFRELKPWIFAALVFPVIFLFKLLKGKNLLKEIRHNHLIVTILILILLPLASLTKYHTRIGWYAIPLYPFIAIYLGYCMELLVNFIADRFDPGYKSTIISILVLLLVVFLGLDAQKLLANEIKPQLTTVELSPREVVVREAKKQPEMSMEYLVAFPERQAREILPPTEQIDMTWVYGGNPCAVYYSRKKVHYFYNIDEFVKELGQKGKLYLLHKDDLHFTEKTKPQIIYTNEEYVLLRY